MGTYKGIKIPARFRKYYSGGPLEKEDNDEGYQEM